MSEVQSKLDNILERLRVLGGTQEQIDWVTREWDGLDEDERDTLYRQNDAVLAQQINDGQDEVAQAAIDNSDTPTTDAALAEFEAQRKAQEEEDWGLLGLAIPTIVETVGDNAEQAWRLHELETQANKPRTSLLADLEKVAWPNGKPDVDADEAARNAALDDAGAG